jgi:hypothetical protein
MAITGSRADARLPLRNHLRRALRNQAKVERENGYQSALRSYSEALSPAMTRKEVEDYLKAKSIKFGQICCVEDERSTLADLIRIGKEHALGLAKNISFMLLFNSLPLSGTSHTRATIRTRLRKSSFSIT